MVVSVAVMSRIDSLTDVALVNKTTLKIQLWFVKHEEIDG